MATNTYVALDKVTIGTATPSITFSSISATYTDLVVVASFTVATASANLVMTFNGDTTSGLYSKTQLEGTGSVAVSGRTSGANNIGLDSNIGDDTTGPSIHILNLMNYANTSVFKTVLHRQSGFWSANPGTAARVGLWRNTNAITSVTLNNGGTNFAIGSTFSLYGIKAVPAWAAKATGGTITNDISYTYHTFTASGTFTPTELLSCDYLVVAGGGGGGEGGTGAASSGGGGGGAGGYRTTVGTSGAGGSAESALSAASGVGLTVTVGGGGATNKGQGSNSVFSTITSLGGGGGGNQAAPTGATGGAGGGSANNVITGGLGTANQGRDGGPNNGANGGGAGGGGASTAGLVNPVNAGGAGGDGVTTIISGSSVAYAGGGGGSSYQAGSAGGAGGLGGGGKGQGNNGASVAGSTNTGAGGGGGNSSGVSSAGGSGIVIIRYAN
jgi:hypothetical protein